MKLITWNVQWCRGVDGKVDPARIVQNARAIADFDVLCLQEIANNFPDPRLAGSRGENQFAELASRLPGFQGVPGAIVDVPDDKGGRRHFGNLILSRAADLDIDLIVMGAYGHSRMRELVMGGVSRTLLASMTVPVLMSH